MSFTRGVNALSNWFSPKSEDPLQVKESDSLEELAQAICDKYGFDGDNKVGFGIEDNRYYVKISNAGKAPVIVTADKLGSAALAILQKHIPIPKNNTYFGNTLQQQAEQQRLLSKPPQTEEIPELVQNSEGQFVPRSLIPAPVPSSPAPVFQPDDSLGELEQNSSGDWVPKAKNPSRLSQGLGHAWQVGTQMLSKEAPSTLPDGSPNLVQQPDGSWAPPQVSLRSQVGSAVSAIWQCLRPTPSNIAPPPHLDVIPNFVQNEDGDWVPLFPAPMPPQDFERVVEVNPEGRPPLPADPAELPEEPEQNPVPRPNRGNPWIQRFRAATLVKRRGIWQRTPQAQKARINESLRTRGYRPLSNENLRLRKVRAQA